MAGLMQRPVHLSYKIRPATLADLELLVRHRRGMFVDMDPKLSRRALDEADRAFRAWARRGMRTKEYFGFVAEAKGRAVASGCVWLQPIQPRPGWTKGRQAYLLGMYTEPEWRGWGIARRIVQAASRLARDLGHPRLTLHASEMGRPIYEKLGFERTWEMKRRLTPRAPARPRRAAPAPSRGRSPTTARRSRARPARRRSTAT